MPEERNLSRSSRAEAILFLMPARSKTREWPLDSPNACKALWRMMLEHLHIQLRSFIMAASLDSLGLWATHASPCRRIPAYLQVAAERSERLRDRVMLASSVQIGLHCRSFSIRMYQKSCS